MPDDRLPLLRGRITSVDTFRTPQGGGAGAPELPDVNPHAHRANLLTQLDAILHQVQARPADARDELATREIIAVTPSLEAILAPDQLDSSREDARLVGIDPDTGTVLLDVASPNLDYLRRKVEEFADDTLIKVKVSKEGAATTRRAKERAIAPIGAIGIAVMEHLQGPRIRKDPISDDQPRWFEIECRGGYRDPKEDVSCIREQITRQCNRLGVKLANEEYLTPMSVYFFARLSWHQLMALVRATDCVHGFDLVPPPIRDLLHCESTATKDLTGFVLKSPPPTGCRAAVCS